MTDELLILCVLVLFVCIDYAFRTYKGNVE